MALPPIICISFPAWEGNYVKSTVQLMKAIAPHEQVLFVDYPYTYKDMAVKLLRRKGYAKVRRLTGALPRLRTEHLPEGGSINILSLPPMIPTNWLPQGVLLDQALKFNLERMKAEVWSAMNQLEMHHPVVINAFNPVFGQGLVRAFNPILEIYYCYDEISAAPWQKRHGAWAEKAYAQKVDGIICSSAALQETKRALNPNCMVVNNGVEASFIDRLAACDPLAANRAQKVIGYVGSIDSRIDLELILPVIEAFANYTFRFVGRINSSEVESALKKCHNVELLGPKPLDELPEHLASFDVGIIPFKVDDFTAGIYPMKMNEYLAAGLPVVSTNFGDMSSFQELARLGNNAGEFIHHIEESIKQNNRAIQIERKAFAAQNTWVQRGEQFRNLLEEMISPQRAKKSLSA
ncbi:MAG: glycosyltransferase [Bacteroidota bacterium]